MSHTHGIDNGEPQVFHFDPCDESDSLHISALSPVTARANLTTVEPTPQLLSHSTTLKSEETLTFQDSMVTGKGKGVTRTLPLSVPVVVASDPFDIHSASMPSTSRGISYSSNILLPSAPSYFDRYPFLNDAQNHQNSLNVHENIGSANMALSLESQSEGLKRESPPILPPLAFSPTELYAPSTSSLPGSPASGPSSYTSSILPLTRFISHTESFPSPGPIGNQSHSPVHRPRSLPSISVQSSRSLTARALSQLKSRLTSSRPSNNLACKFIAKKSVTLEIPTANHALVQSFNASEAFDGCNSSSGLWRTGLTVDELDAAFPRLSDFQMQDDTTKLLILTKHHTVLRHMGRSYFSSCPTSALDIVPSSTPDVFTPIPLVVKNYFDDILPRELRLHIFESLVALHEVDHLRTVRQGRWCVAKASSPRNRWVGRDRGVRELVKLSRVSKSWQALAFDGQLWATLDLHSFPNMIEPLVLRFTALGGQCIRSIDISGNTQISPLTLLDMSDHLSVRSDIETQYYTQLTAINLQGCSALTTRSLHHLLFRSRCLQRLCVKGLKAVTNTTCSILSTYNPQLISLDVSRCTHMDEEGIENMATAALMRGDHLLLKELRMSGIRGLGDDMMASLGRAAPYLEVLDLSYARHLHNSALDAFVACRMEQGTSTRTVLVAPRDLGRSDSNESQIRRRVTRLRHLSLSHCILLTDDACSNLVFSVPDLEFLELGGIGSDLKNDGLIRLLSSTPYIRRIDLEDASQMTDAVLAALTPHDSATHSRIADIASVPGHALEQLNISFNLNFTNEALLSLVRGCTRLRHLEADNTHINSTVLKEFVRLCHQRGMDNAKANVVDCRGIAENTVKDLAGMTRPRMGWRAYEARKLMFLDARDDNADELKVGQDECNEKRVVLKSFYSWQTVDNVKAVREKRRRSKRKLGNKGDSETDDQLRRSLRWWSPGGRGAPRTSGRSSPLDIADMNNDGCRVM